MLNYQFSQNLKSISNNSSSTLAFLLNLEVLFLQQPFYFSIFLNRYYSKLSYLKVSVAAVKLFLLFFFSPTKWFIFSPLPWFIFCCSMITHKIHTNQHTRNVPENPHKSKVPENPHKSTHPKSTHPNREIDAQNQDFHDAQTKNLKIRKLKTKSETTLETKSENRKNRDKIGTHSGKNRRRNRNPFRQNRRRN
jgi:hypothetical protein